MSKTIDEKVVSMQFDNSNFERNVQTSMSTLDKLKNSLKFDGATKGFDSISSAAGKCDMSGLSSGVETVKAKFSALEVMGVTALANITNSAVEAGKKLIAAFTIDPVKTGFSEYELKMGSIQTIMASTGESLETVNKYLDELNKYSDDTIYSFSDMTTNIGKFTNAGVKLEDAVMAIKGISNEAALSGANANEASRAMYNLAQSLSQGYVMRLDWRSIENANMATMDFKTNLAETAVRMGTLTKAADGTYRTLSGDAYNAASLFTQALDEQWLTSDVLIDSLRDYADETTEIGKKATEAATNVKTFTMMMDTLKEAAQSGWAATWEILVGDFEEAKSLWTELSKTFDDMIAKSADSRNAILELAMGDSSWDKLIKQVNEAGIATDDFTEKLKETAKEQGYAVDDLIEKHGSLAKAIVSGDIKSNVIVDTLKKFIGVSEEASSTTEDLTDKLTYCQDLFDKMWRGDFGNGAENRIAAMGEASADYAAIQELVNKHAAGTVLTMDDLADTVVNLSDAQLENMGYTEEQVTAIRKLAEEAEKTGTPINDLIANLEKPSGRELLIDSLRNALAGLSTVLSTLKQAWNDIFYGPDATADDILQIKADRIYKLCEAIHKFSEYLNINEETADKLGRTFKGLFAIIDIIRTVLGGALRIVFRVICELLGMMDVDILDVTASVGDAIVKFRDWLFENNLLARGLKVVIDVIKIAYAAIRKWVKAFLEIPAVKSSLTSFTNSVSNAFASVREYFAGGMERLSEFLERVKALDSISVDNIGDIFKDFRDNVLGYFLDIDLSFDGIKTALINFKDTVFENLGLVGGKFETVLEKLKEFADFVRSKIPAALSIGIGALLIKSISDISGVIGQFSGSIASLVDGVVEIGLSIKKYFNAKSFALKAGAIKDLAIAVLILVGAIAVLTMLDQSKVKTALINLGILAAGLAAFAFAMSKMGKISNFFTGAMILNMGLALLSLVGVMKIVSGMSEDEIKKGLLTIAALELLIIALIKASKLAEGKTYGEGVGGTILKIALSMLVLVGVIKVIAGMEPEDIIKGIAVIAALELLIVALMRASKLAEGKTSAKGIGGTVLKIALSMLVLLGVIKVIAAMDPADIIVGIAVIAALELLIVALIKACQVAEGKSISKNVGGTIFKLGLALLAMVAVMKIVSGMSAAEIEKGLAVIATLELLMVALIAVSKLAGEHAAKAGAMLLMISGSLLILTGVIYLLKDIDTDGLVKAIAAIGALELMFAGLIAVTKYAQNCMSTLIVLTVAIGVMAAALIALSKVDSQSLTAATIALSSVTAAFGVLIASTKSVQTDHVAKTLLMLGGMTLIVAALAIIIKKLAKVKVGSTLEIAASLSMLLLSLSGACSILGSITSVSKSALTTAGIMTAVLLAVAVIVGVMAACDVGPTLEIAASLSILLISISTAALILSKVGPLADLAVPGATKLLGLIGIVSAVLLAVGGILKGCGVTPEDIDVIAEILGGLGKAVGSFFGGIIGGFAIETLSGLGEALSEFMDKAQGFFDGIGDIDGDVLAGAQNLATMLLTLSGANIANSIASIIPGGSSFEDFVAKLKPFGEAICEFSDIISEGGIDTDAVNAASNAGMMMAELAQEIPNQRGGSTLGDLIGDNDMDTFGRNLVSFGRAMVAFSNTISGGAIDSDAVQAAADAGLIMVGLNKEIPTQKGNSVLGFIAGDNDLDTFGANIVPFATAIVAFSNIVSNGSIKNKAIQAAADAGHIMAGLAVEIPTQKGNSLFGYIAGDNDLDTFGANIVPFATAITRFSNIVSNNPIDKEAVKSAAHAGGVMAELARTLPNDTSLFEKWFGGGTLQLDEFGAQIASFGSGLVDFSRTVDGNISDSAVDAAYRAGSIMAELSDQLPDDTSLWEDIFGGGTISMETFGEQIAAFGEGIAGFSEAVQDIDTEAIETAISSACDIFDMAGHAPEEFDLSWLTDGLMEYADVMIEFSEKLDGNVDESAIETVAYVAKTLAEAAEIMPKEVDFTDLSNGLETFGKSLVRFSEKVSGEFDEDAVGKAAAAGIKIADMLATIPTELDILSFSNGITDIADSLVYFYNAVETSGFDKDTVGKAAAAGTKITDMLATIPSDVDALGFATSIKFVAIGLSGFYTAIKDAGINLDTVTTATDAGKKIGGLLESVQGYLDVADFIDNAGAVGKAIGDFCDAVSGESFSYSTIANAATAGEQVASFLQQIPDYVDVTDFIDKLGAVGQALVDFCDAVSSKNFNTYTMTSAASAGMTVASFMAGIPAYMDVASFVDNAGAVGKALSDFSGAIADENFDTAKVDSAITSCRSLITLLTDMSGIVVSGASAFSDSLSILGQVSIDSFVEVFTNSDQRVIGAVSGMLSRTAIAIMAKRGTFLAAGRTIMDALVTGLQFSSFRIKMEFIITLSSSISLIRDYYDSYQGAGEYLVEGFSDGISENTFQAEAAASAMAQAALDAAKEVLDINSPSKVFRKVGKSVPEGFAQGIDKGENWVKKSSKGMANLVESVTRSELGIHSPSTVLYDIGENVAEGLSNGISNSTPAVKSSAEKMAETITETVKRYGEATIDDTVIVSTQTKAVVDDYWKYRLDKENEEQKELYDIENAGKDAAEYTAMTMYDFQKDMVDKTTELLDTYQDKLDDAAEKLLDTSNIFKAVDASEEIASDTLISNLDGQIEQLSTFKSTMTSLVDKLNSTDTSMWNEAESAKVKNDRAKLLDAIREMGVDSLDELKTLDTMTDFELDMYAMMYGKKAELANETAEVQLSDLKSSTEAQLSELFGGVMVNLEELSAVYDETFDSINTYVSRSVEVGKSIALGLANGTSQGTTNACTAASQMGDLVLTAAEVSLGISTLSSGSTGSSEFEKIGTYINQGLADGISESANVVQETVQSTITDLITSAKSMLGIASPSKVFKAIGVFIPQGFAKGIENASDISDAAAESMANSVILSTQTALNRMNDIANSNSSITPTITPVIDMGTMNARSIQLNSTLSASIVKPVDSLSQIVTNAQSEINASNREVVEAVKGLREDLNAFTNAEKPETALYIDSKKVASSTAKAMNRELNILSKRGAYR